jgi:RNA polymerase sigma-70 factor (ECF subfamily)
VYSVLFRLLGNHEDAEDLAQEAFVKAQRGLAWFRGEAAFSTWVYRIGVHLARDRFRAAARRPPELRFPEEAPAARGEPGEELDRRELGRAVQAAIDRLPERLRTPFVLRALEGLDYADVAAATGVTPATARTQVMQARRILARWLGPFLGGGAQ